MQRTAADYETEAIGCLEIAEQNNVGTHQAAYWLARAQVYATPRGRGRDQCGPGAVTECPRHPTS